MIKRRKNQGGAQKMMKSGATVGSRNSNLNKALLEDKCAKKSHPSKEVAYVPDSTA